jgi:hypothetical protein
MLKEEKSSNTHKIFENSLIQHVHQDLEKPLLTGKKKVFLLLNINFLHVPKKKLKNTHQKQICNQY